MHWVQAGLQRRSPDKTVVCNNGCKKQKSVCCVVVVKTEIGIVWPAVSWSTQQVAKLALTTECHAPIPQHPMMQ